MKTLITAFALSVAAIVPIAAHAAPRAPVHTYGQHVVAPPHVYWQGVDLGTDPDPSVRLQMQRDADSSAASNR